MDASTWFGLGTLITAVVGLGLVTRQLSEQRRTMKAALGNLYIQRFWDISDAMLYEEKGTKRHTQSRRRYLQLFEDEFEVARLDFLDKREWHVWHAVLDEDRLRERVQDDLTVCDPEGQEFELLRACLAQRDLYKQSHPASRCSAK